MTRLLLVDYDTELCNILKRYLEAEQFSVDVCHNGNDAIKMANSIEFDVIILDVMLPEMNGFKVLNTLRDTLHTPVIMLTAKNEEIDRIVALDIGADDFLAKPCHPRELVARIQAVTRRGSQSMSDNTQHTVTIDNLALDNNTRTVTLEGKQVELTNAEFNILWLLARSPGQAYSKQELTEKGLKREFTAFDRSIDVHISNLRNKVGNKESEQPKIKTVRGYGYMYDI